MEVTLEHHTMEYAVYSSLISASSSSSSSPLSPFPAISTNESSKSQKTSSLVDFKKLIAIVSGGGSGSNNNSPKSSGGGGADVVLRIPSIYVQRMEGTGAEEEIQKLQQRWRVRAQQAVAQYERIQENKKLKSPFDASMSDSVTDDISSDSSDESEDDDGDEEKQSQQKDEESILQSEDSSNGQNDNNNNNNNTTDGDDGEMEAGTAITMTPSSSLSSQIDQEASEEAEVLEKCDLIDESAERGDGIERPTLDITSPHEITNGDENAITDNDINDTNHVAPTANNLVSAEEASKKKGRSMKHKIKNTLTKMKNARSGTLFSRIGMPASSMIGISPHGDLLDEEHFSLAFDEKLGQITREESQQTTLTEDQAVIQIRKALLRILRWRRFMKFIYGSGELKEQRLRLATVKEILSTERSYVNSLDICMDVFFQPLAGPHMIPAVSPEDLLLELDGHAIDDKPNRNASKETAPQKNVLARMRSATMSGSQFGHGKYSTLLSMKELTTVFGNLPQIRNVNKALLMQLEKEWSKFPVFNVGASMLKFIALFKCYTVFVNGYDRSIAELERLQKNSTKLSHFLEKRYVTSGAHTLSTFLIMPIQRIPRYRMLFKELLKRTPVDHVDHDNIQNALISIGELAEFVNEQKRLDENNIFVRSLQKFLNLRYVHLLQPHRSFIKRGKLQVTCTRKGIADICNVYLFSDMLVIVPCEPSKNVEPSDKLYDEDDSFNPNRHSRQTTAAEAATKRKESIMRSNDHDDSVKGDKSRCEVIFFAFARLLEETLTRRHSMSSRLTSSNDIHRTDLPIAAENSVASAENMPAQEDRDPNLGDAINTDDAPMIQNDDSEKSVATFSAKLNDSTDDDNNEILSFTMEAFMKTTYFVFQFAALSTMEAREWHSNIMQQMQQIHLKIQSKNIYLQSTMGLYQKKRQSMRINSRETMIRRMSRRALLLDSSDLDSETVSAISIDRERGRLYMKLQTHMNRLSRLRTEWDLAKKKSYAAERTVREARTKITQLQKLMTEQEGKKKELDVIMGQIDEKKNAIEKDKDHYLSILQELDAQILSALNGDIGAFREVFNKDPVLNSNIILEEPNDLTSEKEGNVPRHRSRALSSSMDMQIQKLESIEINHDRLVKDDLSGNSAYFVLPQNADALVLLPSLPGTGSKSSSQGITPHKASSSISLLSNSKSRHSDMLTRDLSKARVKKLSSRPDLYAEHRRSRSDLGPIHLSREMLKNMEQFNPAGIDVSALKRPRWMAPHTYRRSPQLEPHSTESASLEEDLDIRTVSTVTDEEAMYSDNEDDDDYFIGDENVDDMDRNSGLKPLPTKGSWYNLTNSMDGSAMCIQKRIMVRSREEIDASNPYVIYFNERFQEHHAEELARLAEELKSEELHGSGDDGNDDRDYVETFNVFYRTRPYEKHFVVEQESLPYRYRFQRRRYCDGIYEIIDSPPLQLKWDPTYDRSDLYTSFTANLHIIHSAELTDTDDPDEIDLMRRFKLSELPDSAEELKLLVLQLSEEARHWRTRFVKERIDTHPETAPHDT